jgi:hypothetical protein
MLSMAKLLCQRLGILNGGEANGSLSRILVQRESEKARSQFSGVGGRHSKLVLLAAKLCTKHEHYITTLKLSNKPATPKWMQILFQRNGAFFSSASRTMDQTLNVPFFNVPAHTCKHK